jgi:hypothetical protein
VLIDALVDRRRSSHRKNGTLSIAVTIDNGSSTGAFSVLGTSDQRRSALHGLLHPQGQCHKGVGPPLL